MSTVGFAIKCMMSGSPATVAILDFLRKASTVIKSVNELFRREAATEGSPGRQPWEDVQWIEQPQKGRQNMSPFQGFSLRSTLTQGLRPGLLLLTPLRG